MNTTNAGVAQGQTHYGESQTVPTTYTGDTVLQEGKVVYVKDMTVASSGSPSTQRSGKMVKTTIVRNVSGITLKARRGCVWKAGFRGRRVDGYSRLTAGEVAGIVDPHLHTNTNGGVREGDLFLLYDLEGPVEVLTSLAGDAENVITEGSFLAALTAATSQATTAGRFIAYDFLATSTATTTGTYGLALKNVRMQAMSAKTTANTNVGVLAGLY